MTAKHIQSFVALDGYIARLRIKDEEANETIERDVPVAGVGLVEQEWLACALGTDGVLAPLEELGEVLDVDLEDDGEHHGLEPAEASDFDE